jgi:hypothetical protein
MVVSARDHWLLDHATASIIMGDYRMTFRELGDGNQEHNRATSIFCRPFAVLPRAFGQLLDRYRGICPSSSVSVPFAPEPLKVGQKKI